MHFESRYNVGQGKEIDLLEQTSSEKFLEIIGPQIGRFDPFIQKQIQEIAQNHLLDLTSISRGYFSFETQFKITESAAMRLKDNLAAESSELDASKLQSLWVAIVRDFHSQNYWGLETVREKPKKEKAVDPVHRELFPYIWAFVQSAIIMKVVVYFFGIRYTRDQSNENWWYITLALLTAGGSLVWFAFRHHRKMKKEEAIHSNEKQTTQE